MTSQELIKHLQELDPEGKMEVMVYNGEYGDLELLAEEVVIRKGYFGENRDKNFIEITS